MPTTRTRSTGEKGVAVVITALCLLPLMIFAAFGVDLTSWHSRISYLQKSADAAALAGTVWMPDIVEATTVACASLERNGIVGHAESADCQGAGGEFRVTVERGSTPTALRVVVLEPNARRYFSPVFRGQQGLTRSAEAEYNLPLPLGSPLNFFGGDRTTTDTTPPNPIAPTRSPGFWAQIEGPDTISTNGDAYSPQCYTSQSCTTIENLQYDGGEDDRGYWYVVRMPGANVGPINIRIFDANHAAGPGTSDHIAGDRELDPATDPNASPPDPPNNFSTSFRVWQQNNPLDFTDRTALGVDPPNTTDGSCNWSVPPATGQGTATVSPFKATWRTLCTLTTYNPGDLYLVNVQTTGDTGNGVNGYALEAVAGSNPQPAVYAYDNMGLYNTNRCSPQPCLPPAATFYLAEVGPQYAGKTLVVSLWDPGDVSGDSTATMTVKRPSDTLPRPVEDIDASDCEYESSPAPNPVQSGADPTGATYATPQVSDDPDACAVRTASGGARRFNGTWVTIRVAIPRDYDCTLNTPATPINPEVDAGSCWWGIEYSFVGSDARANDVTVWSARVEGNPVHLTT